MDSSLPIFPKPVNQTAECGVGVPLLVLAFIAVYLVFFRDTGEHHHKSK